MTPEETSLVATVRQKILAKTATKAEIIEATRILRQGRIGASIASETSRRKSAKAAVPTADDLLKEMGLET